MADDAPHLTPNNFRAWKLLRDFRERVALHAQGRVFHLSWHDPKRKLHQFDYLSLFLFALVNPAVKTMRALCAASQTQRVQEEVGATPVSLGSFSRA